MKNKKILVISHVYYPDSRVGAKRFGNLVPFFVDHFAEVHVLTIPGNQIPSLDPSLSPAGIVHHAPMLPRFPMNRDNIFNRIRTRLWVQHLCLLDGYSGWILPAAIKAIDIINTYKIDIIIATGPPFSTAMVGVFASKTTKKKLILDYRDPWTTITRNFPSSYGKMINFFSEKLALRTASAFVFCSTIMKNDFEIKFHHKKNNAYVLTNGYTALNPEIQPLTTNNGKFTMFYAGNFYGGRNLEIIAIALSNLIRRGVISANNFEFVICGKLRPQEQKTIQKFNLEKIFNHIGLIPYHEVLRRMKGADILFLPSAKEHMYAIPFKTFDYLMVQRPILAVAPKCSAVEEIMRNVPFGVFCSIDDSNGLEITLTEMIKNRKNYASSLPKEYAWSTIAKRYINILESFQKNSALKEIE